MTNKRATAEHGYFRTFDGTKLFYAAEGPRHAPPLFFCYGLVCSRHQWKYQIDFFKKKYRTYYIDLRGHNRSEVPKNHQSLTIKNLAHDIHCFMEEQGIEKMPLLGHSLGVNILLEFARHYPKKASALILLNGTPKDPFETMFYHNLMQILYPFVGLAYQFIPTLVEKIWQEQAHSKINQEFIARVGFNPSYTNRADVNEYLRIASTIDFKVFHKLLLDFMSFDARPWLDQIKTPTLIIAGERDIITPLENQRLMKYLMPKSKLKIIKEGSHCCQFDKKMEVNLVIENYLKKLRTKKM